MNCPNCNINIIDDNGDMCKSCFKLTQILLGNITEFDYDDIHKLYSNNNNNKINQLEYDDFGIDNNGDFDIIDYDNIDNNDDFYNITDNIDIDSIDIDNNNIVNNDNLTNITDNDTIFYFKHFNNIINCPKCNKLINYTMCESNGNIICNHL